MRYDITPKLKAALVRFLDKNKILVTFAIIFGKVLLFSKK